MEKKEITKQIIGCAFKVHNTLGFGFLESVYKKAMVLELKKIGLNVEQEKSLNVYYDNEVVGIFYIDLYVDDEIIVELKSVHGILAQLLDAFVPVVHWILTWGKLDPS